MKRLIVKILIGLLIFAVFGSGGYFFYKSRHKEAAQPISQSIQSSDPQHIRLIGVGDMLPHDAINLNAKQADGGYDYKPMMKDMKPFFDKADIKFCNQAVLGSGERYEISGYPIFNSPTEFARDMQQIGCNVINTATNHANDKGPEALKATLEVWDKTPNILAVAGANRSQEEQDKIRYFETKGLKFAFLAYTCYSNTTGQTPFSINMCDEALIRRQMAEARPKVDFVLVSVRWGNEYQNELNSDQANVARLLNQLGADVIFGHGPHVLQPVRKLKNAEGHQTIVWYSLGNFLSAQIPVETLIGGFAVMDIDVATKQISEPSFLPTYMHYEWTAEQKAKEDLLTRHDFLMFPLDKAAEALARSQNKTTVEAQTERVTKILNSETKVEMLSSASY